MGNHDEFDLDVRLISDRRMQASEPDVAATIPHTQCKVGTCAPLCDTDVGGDCATHLACTHGADCGGGTADCGPTGPNCPTAAQTCAGLTCGC